MIEDKSDEAKKTKVCAFTFYHVVDYVVALPYYTNYATFDQAKVCDFAYHVPALSLVLPLILQHLIGRRRLKRYVLKLVTL